MRANEIRLYMSSVNDVCMLLLSISIDESQQDQIIQYIGSVNDVCMLVLSISIGESQQDQIIHEFCERCMHVAVKY